jgi:hypothetical protein
MANWPLWKVVAVSGLAFVFVAGLLTISAVIPPKIESPVLFLMTGLLVLAGIGFSVWRRLTRNWWASVGVAVALTVLLLAIGIRFWSILVQGTAYWIIVGVTATAYIGAWIVPALSPALSRFLWREQTAPVTRVGRAILRWSLALGLGGAGILGAASGTTLVVSGAASAAYAFIAVGACLATVFLAQSLAHGLWEDRASLTQARSRPKDEEG